jgi:hypothetical protein
VLRKRWAAVTFGGVVVLAEPGGLVVMVNPSQVFSSR